ncbi:MAG: CCA tRNA nucleotidyltransferase [Planctomycetaceae bacterium]|nr:CCA tRNA nucleotidyltransferase [Planctomycetaceae bacterium]
MAETIEFVIDKNPNYDFALEIAEKLQQAGYTAYWAGGCVRDFMLRKIPKDYDVATSARPDEVRQLFGFKKTIPVGAAFGVIIVRSGKRSTADVEVATFRTDLDYLDGRRPSDVVFSTPEEDAQRRDLTFNGLFYDPVARQLHDFVGGQRDLENGLVRAIGIPADRFQEDKLRLLRTIRFAAQLDFKIEPETWEAICQNAEQLKVVSPERIAQELRRMLVDPHRVRALEFLANSGLLDASCFGELSGGIDPHQHAWQLALKTAGELEDPNFPLALAVIERALLFSDQESRETNKQQLEQLGRELRLSNQEIDHATWLVLNHRRLSQPQTRPLAELKRLLVSPYAPDLLKWEQATAQAENRSLDDVHFLVDFLKRTPPEILNPPPLVSGHELLAAGVPGGPQIKKLLDQLRDAQLNLEINSREEALELLTRLKEQE